MSGEITHVGQDTRLQSLWLEGRALSSAFCFHRKCVPILPKDCSAMWGNCPWGKVLMCFVFMAKHQRVEFDLGDRKVLDPFTKVAERWESFREDSPLPGIARWAALVWLFNHNSWHVWSTSGCTSLPPLWGELWEETTPEFMFGLCLSLTRVPGPHTLFAIF